MVRLRGRSGQNHLPNQSDGASQMHGELSRGGVCDAGTTARSAGTFLFLDEGVITLEHFSAQNRQVSENPLTTRQVRKNNAEP